MNYSQHTCQRAISRRWTVGSLKGVFTLFLVSSLAILASCSTDPRPGTIKETAKSVLAEPVWFKVPDRFTLRTEEYDIATHAFFDLTPFKTKEGQELSYFLTTPVGSAHQYDMDMVSGQLYRKKSYCAQNDIWESYDGKIDRPNFSLGVIPRLLDQSNQPQMIWVFGDKDYLFDSYAKGRAQSQRARIVGGFVWQYCEDFPCRTYQNWLSRLVLIGVNPSDPSYKDVTTMAQLKKKADWKYVKAFAQNGWGRSVGSAVPEPAYRMVGEVDSTKALEFAFKAGHEFNFEEINSLRKNCFYLYDYLWRSQKKVRKNMKNKQKIATDKAAKELQKEAERIRKLKSFALNTVFSDNVEKDLKEDEGTRREQQALIDFQRFFLYIYKRYGARFLTCSRFVRPANQRDNAERMWFFAYLQNWFHLEDLNYYYMCPRRSWLANPRLTTGARRFDPTLERNCSSLDLDDSFERGVTVMASLAGSNRPHWRFLEFDNGIGGSHAELFSWVYETGKKLGCNARALEEKRPIFPPDVQWDDFYKNLKKGRFDVIR